MPVSEAHERKRPSKHCSACILKTSERGHRSRCDGDYYNYCCWGRVHRPTCLCVCEAYDCARSLWSVGVFYAVVEEVTESEGKHKREDIGNLRRRLSH